MKRRKARRRAKRLHKLLIDLGLLRAGIEAVTGDPKADRFIDKDDAGRIQEMHHMIEDIQARVVVDYTDAAVRARP